MNFASIWNIDASIAKEPMENESDVGARATYRIDPAASRIEFTIGKRRFFVSHLLVTGRFADVQGTITFDEREPANSWAEVTIGAASLTTGFDNPGRMQALEARKRDAHLRKAEFFDVERYPHLTFTSRHIEAVDRAAGRYRVTGDLTVRDVTRRVELDALYTPALGAGYTQRITITLTGHLNRRDFGLDWDRSYLRITDELTLTLAVEAVRA